MMELSYYQVVIIKKEILDLHFIITLILKVFSKIFILHL